MDGRSERRDDSNRHDSCENRQGHMGAPLMAPVEIVAHGQHLLEHRSTQLRGAGSPGREDGGRDAEPAVCAGTVVEERSCCCRICESEGGWNPLAPRFRGPAVSASCRMGSGSDRFIASRGGTSFGSLGACERLPQTVDRLGETCKLVGEPLRVSLLSGEKARPRR